MIQIPRLLARQVRAVLRKSARPRSSRDFRPPITLRAATDGLRIQSYDGDVAVEHHVSGTYPQETIILPADALDDFEGSKAEPVTLTSDDQGAVLAPGSTLTYPT